MIARIAFSAAFLFSAGAALAYDPLSARPDAEIEPAQTYNRPPAEFDDGLPDGPLPRAAPAGDAQDPAALNMRIERLERDLRRLTGQNEELQHKVQLLEEQLRAAKGDAPRAADAAPTPTPLPAGAPAATTRRGDAFDPASQPAAPGAPKPLGTTSASTPLPAPPRAATGSVSTAPAPIREVGQPMDIAHGRLVGDQPGTAPAEIAPSTDAPPAGPKEEYDLAVASLKAGKYEAAEKSLAAFLTRNPKSKYAPAATFNLGESYFLRGRHREAAEKYLEISTKYAQSSLAPEALLRLGQSLGAIGAREQACASFGEIDVKYPAAPNRIKEAAQRESGKIKC